MDKPTMNRTAGPLEFNDFSLVLGGPLFQLFRRTHLSDGALALLRRRIIVLTLFAWLPLLVLSIVEGHAWGGGIRLTFLRDVEMQMRLLLALPLLIVAELVVHQRIRPIVSQFLERSLIPEAARTQFDAAMASAMRLRNSIMIELLLIVFVYTVGIGLVRSQFVIDIASWYGAPVDGKLQLTMAGWWLGCFSLPLFQFLILRWYFRLFIWARFLCQVARIKLDIMPMHPDRCGGLGFLAAVSYAFIPLLLAQGSMLSGLIANQIFYAGAKLPDFKLEIIGTVAVMILGILGPLLVFAPQIERARRNGIREYGILAQRYVRLFDQKWLRGGVAVTEPLIGSADIQSLADMGNSYEVIKDMRIVPFSLRTVLQLSIITLVPVIPLMLTMISLEDFLEQLIKMVF